MLGTGIKVILCPLAMSMLALIPESTWEETMLPTDITVDHMLKGHGSKTQSMCTCRTSLTQSPEQCLQIEDGGAANTTSGGGEEKGNRLNN